MITKIKQLFKDEKIRYLFAGGCTTCVNIITFFLLRHLTGLDRNICNFIAICFAITFAYFAAKFFVFNFKQDSVQGVILEIFRFVGARIFSMLVEILGFAFLCDSLRFSELPSKIFIQFVVVVLNYIFSKMFVFKQNKKGVLETVLGNWSILLAMLVTLVFMVVTMIMAKVGPFGGGSYTMVDSMHQYVPFFSDYKDKLVNHGSMFYTWKVGMGVNFQSLFFYYLSCPLNLLVIFVTKSSIPTFMTILTVLKIVFSAGTFSYYLSRHKGGVKNTTLITAFGTAYALNNYMLGYMWNVMWLDCIMVLPLIILGFERLMENGDPKLYCLSLTYSLWCNYYISFMICIFLILWFFTESHGGVKKFCEHTLRFAGYSILSGAMTAVSLLTAYMGIMQTAAGKMELPKWTWYQNIKEVLKAHLIFTNPIKMNVFDGGVNLYCGTFVILLAFVYLFIEKEKLVNRVGKFLLLAVMIASCNNELLNYIWHGFHNQYGIPNRFTFLYMFVLLTMAYRAALRLRYISGYYITSALFLAGGFWSYIIYSTYGSTTESGIKAYLKPEVIWTVVITLVCYILFMLRRTGLRKSRVLTIVMSVAFITEILFAADHGMDYIGCANAANSMRRADAMEDITAEVHQMAKDEGAVFYREDMINPYIIDEATMNGMNSIGIFCSTVRGEAVTAAGKLGFYTGANEYLYFGACHGTNMLLGVRHIYATRADYFNPDETTPVIYESDVINVYKNNFALPVAYMVGDRVASIDLLKGRDINNVNDLVAGAADNNDILYKDVHFELIASADRASSWVDGYTSDLVGYSADGSGKPVVNATFTVDKNGRYVVDIIANNVYKIRYYKNDVQTGYDRYQSQIFDLGELKVGDKVELSVEFNDSYSKNGSIRFDFAELDKVVLANDYAKLMQGALDIKTAKDGYLKGKINAGDGGMMFVAVPYDEGWSAYVDGKKVKIEKVQTGFMGVNLSAGEHDIEMKYTAPGFWPGMLLTIAAWCLFVFLLINNKVKNERKLKRARSRAGSISKNESPDSDDSDDSEDDDYDEDESGDDYDEDESEENNATGNNVLEKMKSMKN
ncbi:MAG: YfhO family protein [Eubacterium sp.]|nr:YfhO family protein [Eubacterium sp.]